MNIDIIGHFATRAEAEAHAARIEAYAERKHANPAAGFSVREIDFSIVALNFIENGTHERIGEYATEAQARNAALYIIDRANALHTPDSPPLKTPRGTFPIRHIGEADADAEGFSAWFHHAGFYILRSGETAFAVPFKVYDPTIEIMFAGEIYPCW